MSRLTPKNYQALVKVFRGAGCEISRHEGDHLVMTRAGLLRPLVIPMKPDVPVFVIVNLLRTARMPRTEYLRRLRGKA